ncbi:urea ABC transporter permease subunit UrtC [uncultured Zobellia sp.]|uniref:urea ABC transporter permease subunit UrtC n=1 Tax=uncultured Zobellia sp. TaxID=255433 RepID=UPI0025963B43|nr:urea ABC transporter permease subunit UrtC [uncultured Zobellia sp.]
MKQKTIYTIIISILIVLPVFLLSDFRLSILSKFLVFAMVAIAVNLLWGYAGILSLGHGVYFALGGYAMAMYMKLQTQPIPDFMEWSGVETLPWFWKPFQYLPFALAMTIILPVILALLVGIPLFRSGTKGVYFTIISQAIALIISILFVGQQGFTGGSNGITGFNGLFGYPMGDPTLTKILYGMAVVILIAMYFLSKFMVSTHGGVIIQAIRDRETRLRFLGYRTDSFKILTLATSAAMCGVAGALFVPIVGIISPSTMSILMSTEFVIWIAIGGRATLLGPIIGALVINYAKTGFSESLPEYWWYFYGFLFIAATLIIPKGLVGTLGEKKWFKSVLIKLNTTNE